MDIRIKNLLNSYKSRETVNKDTYLNLQINSDERLLPPGEINKVVDLTDQFTRERESCSFYRILGKINPLISNPLFNITGTQFCWQVLDTPLFKTNRNLDKDNDLSYPESIKTHLKEIDGWYGYFDPILSNARLCNFFDMIPQREQFSFTPDTRNNIITKNWELIITYPYDSDKRNYVVTNGLIIVDKVKVLVGGKLMTALSVPTFHNLSEGDIVRISGSSMDNRYLVKRVGLDDGSLKRNYFCIDVDYNSFTLTTNTRMSKIYNEIESEYYFRKFKKIKTKSTIEVEPDDYEVYKLGFSETIFLDDVTQFVFNEDIDVSNLTDNLNRPLSEIYLTIIKTNGNNTFSNISSGIEAPVLSSQIWNTANSNQHLKQIPVIQKIHNVPSWHAQTFNSLESSVDVTDNEFYGDIVEYNITTVNEVILSDVYHRFNTVNRETAGNSTVNGPRPEGYYYKAHHKMQIRNFSSYVEEGDTNTVDKPVYASSLPDGRYYWRDLLEIGNNDVQENVVDYPFLNGSHYLYQEYIFELKRQDPFDNWDLFFSAFPPDPIGNTISDNIKVNISDNVC